MQILNNFGIQPILLLAQIVNFLIILVLLRKFFYGPIVKALNDRKNRIEESLKNVDLIEEKLEKTKVESQTILDEARHQAQVLLTDAKKEAQRVAQQALTDNRRTQAVAAEQAKSQIEAQREQMKKEVMDETMNMVSGVVKKVLGHTMSTSEKQAMTKQAVVEITKQIS